MKKFFLNKCATLVMALAMILGLGLTTPRSQAAGSCVVTFSDPTVTVGQTFTVNVRVTGAVAIATDSLIYIGLGFNGHAYNEASYLRDWWQYNPLTEEWKQLQDYQMEA